ncbi:MAG: OmpA family protein [Simplicispira sp.]|nr:OmpA family protein [Simplicispira sp.]
MSFSSSDDDSQQRFALGFLFALIALLLTTVVGVVVYQRGIARVPAPAPTTAGVVEPIAMGATSVDVALEAASVRVEGGVVKFYFTSGSAAVAAGANEALADVVKGVSEGKKAVVSGFHDDTGGGALNAELAKQRALAVRDALMALGVAEGSIQLQKPEQMLASGNNAEARRVEVVLSAQ